MIKVCGITSTEDARMVAALGADWVGLNFHPASPRQIDEKTAKDIIAALPLGCEAVGLFVDRPPGEVREVAQRLGLHLVQLHGSEPPTDIAALEGLDVIKAFRIGSLSDVESMGQYLAEAAPFAVLVDAFVAGRPGGTGQTLADELLMALPRLERLVLAGGLTPANVAERLTLARPWMVDVASGVESAPGRKDPAKVAAFVQAARSPG